MTALSDEDAHLRAAVRSCQSVAGTGFVYGGLVHGDGVRLTAFLGSRTHGLHDLLVRPGKGLGGKVCQAQRPETVTNYPANAAITHEYDEPVLAEGIRSAAAVPVLVGRQTRGLLYAVSRTNAPLGDRVLDSLSWPARRLADRLRVDDEVATRIRHVRDTGRDEDVRDVYRELREIAQLVDNPEVRS